MFYDYLLINSCISLKLSFCFLCIFYFIFYVLCISIFCFFKLFFVSDMHIKSRILHFCIILLFFDYFYFPETYPVLKLHFFKKMLNLIPIFFRFCRYTCNVICPKKHTIFFRTLCGIIQTLTHLRTDHFIRVPMHK